MLLIAGGATGGNAAAYPVSGPHGAMVSVATLPSGAWTFTTGLPRSSAPRVKVTVPTAVSVVHVCGMPGYRHSDAAVATPAETATFHIRTKAASAITVKRRPRMVRTPSLQLSPVPADLESC